MTILRPALLVSLLAASSAIAQDTRQPAPTPKEPAKAPAPAAAKSANTIDPEAKKLYDESKAAVKRLKDLSYTAKQIFDEGGEPQTAYGRVTIGISAKPTPTLPYDRYRIVLTDAKGVATAEWACDAKRIQKLDPVSKTLSSTDVVKDAEPPRDLLTIIPRWIFDDFTGNEMLQTTSIEFAPDLDLAGVKTKVLKHVASVEFPPPEQGGPDTKPTLVTVTITRAIGAEDKLPRRIDEVTVVTGPQGHQKFTSTVEFTSLKADAGLKAQDFKLALPDGFKAVEASASDLGIRSNAAPHELKVKPGQEAPPFTLKDTTGKEVSSASLKGRIVLLDFWATWCGPCKMAMPTLQKLHEKYGDKGLSVVGVNIAETSETAAGDYMKDQSYTYTCLLRGEQLADACGVGPIPTLILIGRDGKVLYTAIGASPETEAAIEKMIEEELTAKDDKKDVQK